MITKYRGLSISDNNKGQWVYGNLIVDGNYAYIVNGVIECNDQYITIAEWCPVDHKTIGAFTGRVDKNDQEIFEGDVVVVLDSSYTVFYDDKTASFRLQPHDKRWNTDYMSNYAHDNSFEVIGNIYENPELVEANNVDD